jgi:hypothetical protein
MSNDGGSQTGCVLESAATAKKKPRTGNRGAKYGFVPLSMGTDDCAAIKRVSVRLHQQSLITYEGLEPIRITLG